MPEQSGDETLQRLLNVLMIKYLPHGNLSRVFRAETQSISNRAIQEYMEVRVVPGNGNKDPQYTTRVVEEDVWTDSNPHPRKYRSCCRYCESLFFYQQSLPTYHRILSFSHSSFQFPFSTKQISLQDVAEAKQLLVLALVSLPSPLYEE